MKEPEESQTDCPAKNRILIVDDDKTNLMFLDNLLSKEYALHIAKDGEQALKRAVEYPPDLILLDIIMPGMSGYDVLTKLKGSEKTRDIPVIFITGLDTSEAEMKGLELGADDYIFKPFNDDIVRLRIKNQLKNVNQMRSMVEQEIAEKSNRVDMPLIFFRCRECKREFKNYQDASVCETAHLQPVSVKNMQYTTKHWLYQVEVIFNDGSKRLYNADDLNG